MKKNEQANRLDQLLTKSWMDQLDSEMDPGDTMGYMNRMAMVTSELVGRLGAIIEELEPEKKK